MSTDLVPCRCWDQGKVAAAPMPISYMAFPEKDKMTGITCSRFTLPANPRQWNTMMDKPPKAILSMSKCGASFWTTPLDWGLVPVASLILTAPFCWSLGSTHTCLLSPHLLLFFLWLLSLHCFSSRCFFLKPCPACVCCFSEGCLRRTGKDGRQPWRDTSLQSWSH